MVRCGPPRDRGSDRRASLRRPARAQAMVARDARLSLDPGTTVQSMRLFIGIPVSLQTANALAQCVETLARRAKDARLELRWVAPASYHITLKFLGWTRDDAIPAIRDRVAAAIAGT